MKDREIRAGQTPRNPGSDGHQKRPWSQLETDTVYATKLLQLAEEILTQELHDMRGTFRETITIDQDGRFILKDENGRRALSHFANLAHIYSAHSPQGYKDGEGLYKLAYELRKKNPSMSMTFNKDNDDRSITYAVRNAVPPQSPDAATYSSDSRLELNPATYKIIPCSLKKAKIVEATE